MKKDSSGFALRMTLSNVILSDRRESKDLYVWDDYMDTRKGQTVDVICQHSKDGTIISIKVRLEDEDGEYRVEPMSRMKLLCMNA